MNSRRLDRTALVALSAFLLSAGLAVAFMIRFTGTDLSPWSRGYEVRAVVPDAAALATHADVRDAGVKIGEVAGVRPAGSAAVLRLRLDERHAPVYRDARVLIRAKTLQGEKYVSLDPGRPSAGAVPPGGLLPLDRADEAVQMDQVLSIFDRRRRHDLRRVISGMSRALGHRGPDLNRFLEASAALARDNRPVAETLAGRRLDVAAMIDDLGAVTRALGDRRDAIRLLVTKAKKVAATVAARDARLRETLTALPGFLHQARATTTRLGGYASEATPVVRNMRIAFNELAPAVTLLRPTSLRARRAMRALGGFTARAIPMFEHERPFMRAAAAMTKPLGPFLRQINPFQAYLAPYAEDLGETLKEARQTTAAYDALGHYARVASVYSRGTVAGTLTPEQLGTLEALRKQGLDKVDRLTVNAYPRPGEGDRFGPFEGTYPRLTAEAPYR